ncbi:U-scoloptoxin(01)-Cw1a-like [Penaeus chinensis]|uniref:U-scoloptoxin(01)-Cw1a-like n=1 Tax=Penaeus chinensis TaxID=139456 RepID=UPI001FB78ECF|nr:U-scoloptoxin(01)-Cw1a-like [Penaeus chinensis]
MRVLYLLASLAATSWARMLHSLPGGFGALVSSFDCHEKIFGYYADVENHCRAYHVCHPLYTENGALLDVAHFSFMCGMNLVFSQDSLTCSHRNEAFPCDQAPSLYEVSNSDFGVVTEKGEKRGFRDGEDEADTATEERNS